MSIKGIELPDTEVHIELSRVFQALADYQMKRETMSRRWMFTAQKSLDRINDLCNLAMEHRYALAEIGFLRPMQKIISQLIQEICQGIESHGYDADHLIVALDEINETVREAVEGYERRKRYNRNR